MITNRTATMKDVVPDALYIFIHHRSGSSIFFFTGKPSPRVDVSRRCLWFRQCRIDSLRFGELIPACLGYASFPRGGLGDGRTGENTSTGGHTSGLRIFADRFFAFQRRVGRLPMRPPEVQAEQAPVLQVP